MASISTATQQLTSDTQQKRDAYPADSIRYDLLIALIGLIFTCGLFLDGWAHNHGQVDDSFFTPWHAVFYTGFLLAGAALVLPHFRNVTRGYAWTKALPAGYLPSLMGVVLFGMGGFGDMLWHETFGVEENLEALFSPTHLLLATGMFLVLVGPLRAAWLRRGKEANWRNLFPAILALTSMLSVITFLTQYAHFMTYPYALAGSRPTSFQWALDLQGVVTILIPVAILMGGILFALRRWRLPFGSVTFILVGHMLLMIWTRFEGANDFRFLLAMVAAGLLADVLIHTFKPSVSKPNAMRLFGFAVPFVMALVFLMATSTLDTRGLWWEVHMWLGVPFVAGIVGLLLSFLVVPPAIPVEERG